MIVPVSCLRLELLQSRADGRARRRIRRRCAWDRSTARHEPRSAVAVPDGEHGVRVVGVDGEQHDAPPAQAAAGKISPAAIRRGPVRRLEQQHAVRGRDRRSGRVKLSPRQAHAHGLAEAVGARQPSRAHRREPLVDASASVPARKAVDDSRRRSSTSTSPRRPARQRGRRPRGLRGMARDIDADARHEPIEPPVRRRSRIPAGCPRACGRPPARRSATCSGDRGRRGSIAATASPTASAAAKPSCAAVAAERGGRRITRNRDCPAARRSRAAAAAAGGLLTRPDHRPFLGAPPRPGAWPRRWCCRASRSAAGAGSSARAARSSREERRRRGGGAVGQRRRDRRRTARSRPPRPQAPPPRRGRSAGRRRARLVEIHHLDDAHVVVGADHAGEHADHGEPVEARIDGREEDIELRQEAGERRDARQREHEDGERQRQTRLGARRGR